MSKLNRKIRRTIYFAFRKGVILSLVATIVFLCIAASVSSVNTFIVYDGDNVTLFNNSTDNPANAIAEQGITVDETKYIVMPETTEHGVAKIFIYPKKKIEVKISDETKILYTEKDISLSELLTTNNITVGADDITSLPLTNNVTDGMKLEITRVTRTTQDVYQELPFKTETRDSDKLEKGKTQTVQKGVKGSKKIVYEIESRNGVEFEKKVISETVVKEPVNEIIEKGTKVPEPEKKPESEQTKTKKADKTKKTGNASSSSDDSSNIVTTWSGEKLKYKKKLSMRATAYSTEGMSDKRTATGETTRVGYVAVDPSVIPLGSRLYIVAANGKSWNYGIAVAADTGVRGNTIDLYFNTQKECVKFGIRKATVYVLS